MIHDKACKNIEPRLFEYPSISIDMGLSEIKKQVMSFEIPVS